MTDKKEFIAALGYDGLGIVMLLSWIALSGKI